MKKFLKFWLAPLLLMAFIFPVGNKALASHRTYEIFVAAFRWVFPHASRHAAGMGYLIFRKGGHFVTYGLMAVLFDRALRGGRRPRFEPSRLLAAGAAAAAYGFLDEMLQRLVPGRTGNLRDWAVDCAGVVLALALTARRARLADDGRLPPPGPRSVSRALFLKRPFDIALSLLGLVLSLPVSAAAALAVRLEDGGPVFYAQERVGRNGRTFKALKFRSMVPDAERGLGPVQAKENDPRTTRVGRVLRATAMDELPQLFNILKGDMSFVGPRALRPSEFETGAGAGPEAVGDIRGGRERHAVRPGLTGLAQVYLPGDTPRRKKFRYDLLYIRTRSFWRDLELIALSFWITCRGKWEFRGGKI